MLDLSTILKYYKRREIQEAIVAAAENREVAVRFGDKGFGKRPDTLKYAADVIEFAKQRASSFHCSEELWSNPLQIDTSLKKKEMDSLRIGWDLVLDIDCPSWTLSKIIAWLLIKSLKEHGVNSITSKFSGNKGFHIGVPFESMPLSVRNTPTKDLFPEGPRKIASYLIDYIGKNYTKVSENSMVEFGSSIKLPLNKIIEISGKKPEEIIKKFCTECGKEIKKEKKESGVHFVCGRCEATAEGNKEDKIKECPKCGSIMERIESKRSLCGCGSNSYVMKFIPSSVLEVDTILISSRHLYRMPYSLHEKSGLASVPVDPNNIMNFEKSMAKPETVNPNLTFLDRSNVSRGEAENLLLKSLHYSEAIPGNETETGNKGSFRNEIHLQSALPKELFPPCIKKILSGIEDGKKRSVFVLLNFLRNVGWDYEKIEELLVEWNKKNPEPLREVTLKGQLRYHKQNKKDVLPANCDNASYYKDIGVCFPDNLCAKIKNPVSYSLRKARFLNRQEKKGKKQKDE